MIMTKSCSCKGVTSKKYPQNMCAGYDYNPTLLNLQCLILGLKDLTLKFKKKKTVTFVIILLRRFPFVRTGRSDQSVGK